MARTKKTPVVRDGLEFYKDDAGAWRWRLRPNGRIVADSGEGYVTKAACVKARWRIGQLVERATFYEMNPSFLTVKRATRETRS